jgi:hypothetical protein
VSTAKLAEFCKTVFLIAGFFDAALCNDNDIDTEVGAGIAKAAPERVKPQFRAKSLGMSQPGMNSEKSEMLSAEDDAIMLIQMQ